MAVLPISIDWKNHVDGKQKPGQTGVTENVHQRLSSDHCVSPCPVASLMYTFVLLFQFIIFDAPYSYVDE